MALRVEHVSPLMSEAEAMKELGCDAKGLRTHIRRGRLRWYKDTRTFARVQIVALSLEIEKEILNASNETAMGSEQPEMGNERRKWKGASLV